KAGGGAHSLLEASFLLAHQRLGRGGGALEAGGGRGTAVAALQRGAGTGDLEVVAQQPAEGTGDVVVNMGSVTRTIALGVCCHLVQSPSRAAQVSTDARAKQQLRECGGLPGRAPIAERLVRHYGRTRAALKNRYSEET